jgi:hypothetical protein
MGAVSLDGFDPLKSRIGDRGKAFAAARKGWEGELGDQLKTAGYPAKADRPWSTSPRSSACWPCW